MIDNCTSIWDLKELAQQKLPDDIFAYLSKGTEDDRTVHRNMAAYQLYQIRPRRLVDVRQIDTSVTLFGERWHSPIILAPVGFQGVFHDDGELASVKAAQNKGHLMIASTVSNNSFAAIAEQVQRKPWFQLYPTTDRSKTKILLQRAQDSGAKVVVLTTDVPTLGNRKVHVRYMGHLSKDKQQFANLKILGPNVAVHDPSMTWDIIAWLRTNTNMKIVLKGIVTAEDAQLALEYGADGMVVSNHGGRQLESNLSTIECLEEIAAVVQGQIPLLLDGGIRRATDIIKALALGADAICVGRAFCYGLAAGGQVGVEKALEILQTELVRNMQLMGVNKLKDLNSTYVKSCPVLPFPFG